MTTTTTNQTTNQTTTETTTTETTKPKANLTSVRTLITSVTECARTCRISMNGVYRWIKVNRIPGKYLTEICNLYDVELRDLIPLTGSELENDNPALLKPKDTLGQLLEVYRGAKTIAEVSKDLDVPEKSLRSTLSNWGDELPTLYTTLRQLDEKRISIAEACDRLKCAKFTLHGLRRKYGFSPGRLKRLRPVSTIKDRKQRQRDAALRVVAGRGTLKGEAETLAVSQRTILRALDELTTRPLAELSHWPKSFRVAFSEELNTQATRHIEKWVEFAKLHKLMLPKYIRYPKPPKTWENTTAKRMIVAVLLDDASLEEIAASRGGDPGRYEALFSEELAPIQLDYAQVRAMSVFKQTALAELLLAMDSRRRRIS